MVFHKLIYLTNSKTYLNLYLVDYFKLPAGTGGAAPFPVSGGEVEDIGEFEARRRKLGYIWITYDARDAAGIQPWVSSSSSSSNERQITAIQPIPTSAQMLLGEGEEDEFG